MAPLSHRPTIFDLARLSGLSKSTISAALLGDHRIAAKTRERVGKLANELGYVRNAHASTLATRSSIKAAPSIDVAIISRTLTDSGPSDAEGKGVFKRMHELGYERHLFNETKNKSSYEKLQTMFFQRGYRGVIFDTLHDHQSEIFSLDWEGMCLVCIGRSDRQPPCDFVRSNSFQSVALAWNEIQRAGYRRIGFVLPRHQPSILDDSEREASLWACQQTLPIGDVAVPPFLGVTSEYRNFEEWFRRHQPEVVVGFNNTHYSQLLSMGLQIPKDVSYVNLHYNALDETIAGVDQCSSEIWIKAAEHLDFLIRHKRTGFPAEPWEMLGPLRWIQGASLPFRS